MFRAATQRAKQIPLEIEQSNSRRAQTNLEHETPRFLPLVSQFVCANVFGDVEPDPALLDARILRAAGEALERVEPWTASEIEVALKLLCEDLGEKARAVFAPIRVAVTGSKVSPGLYESLELLGRESALERIRRGAEASE